MALPNSVDASDVVTGIGICQATTVTDHQNCANATGIILFSIIELDESNNSDLI